MNDKKNTPIQDGIWDRGEYRTGSVEPTRKHSVLVPVLLILVVVLMGLITILSVVNARLFAKLNGQQQGDLSLSLQPSKTPTTTPKETTVELGDREETIVLQDLPTSTGSTLQSDGLPLQQIYSQNIDSVVAVICHNDQESHYGTGVVISQDGYIVTGHTVVADAQQILVQLGDQRQLMASLVGTDAATDLAVLHVDATDLTAAGFGDSELVQVGDTVCAIGDPLGAELPGTMTDGIICAINKDISTGGRTMTLLQTNAMLDPGSPLINRFGQVVGINTNKPGDDLGITGMDGLGFAIPSATVKSVVDQLIHQGYVSGQPFLGIQGEAVSEVHRHYYGLPEGLVITQISDGSDAQIKGLSEGDILVSVDGISISDVEGLTKALYDYEVGDTIQVVIFRQNTQYVFELTIEEAKG